MQNLPVIYSLSRVVVTAWVRRLAPRLSAIVFPLLAYEAAATLREVAGQSFSFPFVLASMFVAYLGTELDLILSILVSFLLALSLLPSDDLLHPHWRGEVLRLLIILSFCTANGYTIYILKRQRDALRVQARETLASEERYRSLVETANEGIWFQAVDGSTRYANRRMAELLRVDHAELLTGSVLSFIHPEDLEEILARRDRVLGGAETEGDVRLCRADGSVGWFLTRCAPMRDEEGQVIGLLAMVTDITARRTSEERLRQALEAMQRQVAGEDADLDEEPSSATGSG